MAGWSTRCGRIPETALKVARPRGFGWVWWFMEVAPGGCSCQETKGNRKGPVGRAHWTLRRLVCSMDISQHMFEIVPQWPCYGVLQN